MNTDAKVRTSDEVGNSSTQNIMSITQATGVEAANTQANEAEVAVAEAKTTNDKTTKAQAAEAQAGQRTENSVLHQLPHNSVTQSKQGSNNTDSKEDDPQKDTVPNGHVPENIASMTNGGIGSTEAAPQRGTEQPSKTRILLWPTLTTALLLPCFGVLCWSLQQVMVSQHPKFGRIALSPSHTLLLITAVTQVFLLILHILMNSVLDALRWQLAVREKGVAFITFLALSGGTSMFGAFKLVSRGRHLIWTLHKYIYIRNVERIRC
jgi:hypothetical protein